MHTQTTGVTPTEAQQAARDRFAAMSEDEVSQDINRRAAVIRAERTAGRVVTAGTERAMRKMLTGELGVTRIRYPTLVTLHRILSRLETNPAAVISRYDDTLGDERTIRNLQQALASAGYLTQAPLFYGNGKATLQAFKGTGKPRQQTRLIPSVGYWDGLEEFSTYDRPASVQMHSSPAQVDASEVPY